MGTIAFTALTDDLVEGTETITITLDSQLNLGDVTEQTLTISEQDVLPTVALGVTQADVEHVVVNRQDGAVDIAVEVNHPDNSKNFNYQWSTVLDVTAARGDAPQQVSFDPSGLEAGAYKVGLRVVDQSNADPLCRPRHRLDCDRAGTGPSAILTVTVMASVMLLKGAVTVMVTALPTTWTT